MLNHGSIVMNPWKKGAWLELNFQGYQAIRGGLGLGSRGGYEQIISTEKFLKSIQ